ncbi:hypothetical protein [Symbiobacterium terraclitae]|uniref:hypothetical protein n=1 Tax=Symbiobacterium terraclitae TaxID=557451 RepID=UPI0035B506E8
MSADMPTVGARAAWVLRGVVAGFGAAAAVLALTLGYLMRAGLVVTVETGALSARLAAEVQAAVRRELPPALEAVRAEVPARVSAEARRRLSELRVELGGMTFDLPEAAEAQVEQAVDQAVRAGVDALTGMVDVDGLAERIAGRAAAVAQARVAKVLEGQRLEVQVAPGVEVPVRIRAR